MTAMAKIISVKDTAFGQDMLEVLAERQLEKIAFRELDIPCSIVTLKDYLVKEDGFCGELIVGRNRYKTEVHMGRPLVHMDDCGEDILLSHTLRNEVKSRLEIGFLFFGR